MDSKYLSFKLVTRRLSLKKINASGMRGRAVEIIAV